MRGAKVLAFPIKAADAPWGACNDCGDAITAGYSLTHCRECFEFRTAQYRMTAATLVQTNALIAQLAQALRQHAPNHELLASVFLPRGFEVGE